MAVCFAAADFRCPLFLQAVCCAPCRVSVDEAHQEGSAPVTAAGALTHQQLVTSINHSSEQTKLSGLRRNLLDSSSQVGNI